MNQSRGTSPLQGSDTGKVVLKPDKRKLTTKRRKLKGIMRLRASGRLSDADVQQIKSSMISHLQQGNAVKAIEDIKKS